MKRASIVTSAFCLAGLFSFVALTPTIVSADAASTYKQKCAACHGPNGKADTPAAKAMNVRSFSDPAVQKISDSEMEGIITNGKGKMPKYGASLKPEEIKELVNFVRSLGR